MGKIILAVAVLAALASGVQAGTWNGVNTDLQAERGAVQYQQHCARCHGAGLAGP